MTKFDSRLTELMAVAASVTANCQTCVTYHVERAAECGADREAIQQAIDIGRLVRNGAATERDHVVAHLLETSASPSTRHERGCACAANE